MPIAATRHVLTVSTAVSRGCAYCHTWMDSDRFQESVNHLMQEHGCELLHVGTETENDQEGKPWHNTVAVLGSEIVPPPLEAPSIVVVPFKVEPDKDA